MTVKEYMKLPYNINIKHIEDESGNYFVANIVELLGCHADGETEIEALKNLKEAMEVWLEVAIENNDKIPLPKTESEYSGKFLIRIPKTLHQQLSQKAEKEGISLNQYALYKLSIQP
jgi:predicted RNase H-like HicB family nuclease